MNEIKITRRDFLKVSGLAAGAFAGAGLFEHISNADAAQLLAEMPTVKYTADVMCPAECGLAVNVVNGVASAIYGNPYVPYNAGTVCAKGAAGLQLVYNPNRIKYPMIRVGERGEGKFNRVSWDEAIAYIADRLTAIKKQFGPETVIFDAGDVTDRDPYWRLFFAYGTPHCTEHGAICDTPRRHGPKLMLGGKRIEPDVMRPVVLRQADGSLKNDYSYHTKLIVYVGWNPFTATRINYESRGTVGAKVAGAKIIVIDPAFSNTATKADQWIPIRPGTDADLLAAVLRYLIENDNPNDPFRHYIDWSFQDYSVGWDEFLAEFKGWWNRKDPINGLNYFTLEWAAQRTDISAEHIAELAHTFGITKPASVIPGMNGIGHHYNGYIASILGAVLNVITGNLDVPGGGIDTELTKSDKGGSATGGQFLSRKVKRTVNGKEVEATQTELHMDAYGDWPVAYLDGYGVVGDYPRRFLEDVTLTQGPFRGYKYPLKAYFLRTGNVVITGSNTDEWIKALTAKDDKGNYKLDLFVYIDTPFLESGMYADVVLPEASYLERMSLSDVYPSHPMIWLRDFVIGKQFESKTPYDIMQLLAKALADRGDPDVKASDFWDKYKSEEDFWTEALAGAPGRPNVGTPLPYPQYPAGYKLVGTPDSLETGNAKVDDTKKQITGDLVTVKWMRDHHGVAVWPMSWNRLVSGGILKSSTGKVEFKWDWTEADKRYGRYSGYNKLIEGSGNVPPGIAALGWTKYPSTFYWYETKWNPYTNPDFVKYKNDYPFQVISGRVHHTMSATQMVDWLGRITAEDLWVPLDDTVEYDEIIVGPNGPQPTGRRVTLPQGSWSIGVVQMNRADADRLGLKSGDMAELETPLGHKERGKINAVETIRPGTLRVALGAGGRFSPGLGETYYFRNVTVNGNLLVDPNAHSPIMGMPAYADILVKVTKV